MREEGRVGGGGTGEKEGVVISPGKSLSSLQVGVKLGDRHSGFSCAPTPMLLSIALRIKSQNVVSVLEQNLGAVCFFPDQAAVVFLSPVVPCW